MTDKKDIDVNKLLLALDNDDNENFLKLNKELIQKYKNDVLQKLQLKREELKDLHKKLKKYRYIDDLSDIKYGSFIRWINIKDSSNLFLTNGCIITDINFYDDGVQIKCKNFKNQFFSIKYDECLIFQKLTQQEEIILNIIEELKK
jgi:hypothetical protein